MSWSSKELWMNREELRMKASIFPSPSPAQPEPRPRSGEKRAHHLNQALFSLVEEKFGRNSGAYALVRFVVLVGVVAGFYLLIARCALFLAFEDTNASPVWPPSGIVLAGMLVLDHTLWPGIFIGATSANAWVFAENLKGSRPVMEILLASLAIGFGNTGEALIGKYLIHRFVGKNVMPVKTIGGTFKFLLFCPLASLCSSLVGAVTLCLWGLVPWHGFQVVFFTWWLGDFSAMFTFTPCILCLYYKPEAQWTSRTTSMLWAEAMMLCLSLVVICTVIFGGYFDDRHIISLPYLVMPIVIWAAFRFNQRGLPATVSIISFIAMWGTINHIGPFQRDILNESLLQVQLFVSVLSIMGILLASAVSERNQSANAIIDLNFTLEQRVEERTNELKATNAELIKSKETAQAASLAKTHFLANMSHEIRTPIHGILGMTDLTLDTELTPEQREQLETVSQSAHHLLIIVNDILDISKIEAGKLELDIEPFELKNLLDNSMRMLTGRAKLKSIDLDWSIGSDVPDIIMGDPSRLKQCLVNLVGNAVKFTDKGTIAVNVRTETLEGVDNRLPISRKIAYEKELWLSTSKSMSKSSNSKKSGLSANSPKVVLLFSVQDNGIGIPLDKQEIIFRSFEQADSSMTRMYGGTGLGLSITSRLVSMMNGRIWVESEAGKGSTFYFSAVFGIPPRSQASDPTAQILPSVGRLSGSRSLLPNSGSERNISPKNTSDALFPSLVLQRSSSLPPQDILKELAHVNLPPLSSSVSFSHPSRPTYSELERIPAKRLKGKSEVLRETGMSFSVRETIPEEYTSASEDGSYEVKVMDALKSSIPKETPPATEQVEQSPRRTLSLSHFDEIMQDAMMEEVGESMMEGEKGLEVIERSLKESSKREESGSSVSKTTRPREEEATGVRREEEGVLYERVLRNRVIKIMDVPTPSTSTSPSTPAVRRFTRQSSSTMRKSSSRLKGIKLEGEEKDLLAKGRSISKPKVMEDRSNKLESREERMERRKRAEKYSLDLLEMGTENEEEMQEDVGPSDRKGKEMRKRKSDVREDKELTKTMESKEEKKLREEADKEKGQLRVLLADDSLVNQKVACQFLRKMGMQADAVGDGAQALERLEQHPSHYHLLLLDVQMPVLDGLETIKEIRKREKEKSLPHLPVIGLTAHASEVYREQCINAGMDNYVSKPFTVNQLTSVIKEVLESHGIDFSSMVKK